MTRPRDTDEDSIANVRRLPHRVGSGRVGIVGPAGTATQELAARLRDFSSGVSRLIYVPESLPGSAGDAAETLRALDELVEDDATDVVLVATCLLPPEASEAILDRLLGCRKPVVVCMIGAGPDTIAHAEARRIDLHTRSKPAALAAALASGVDISTLDLHVLNRPLIEQVRGLLRPSQRYIQGLFTSTGLCAESLSLALETHRDVFTNLVGTSARTIGPADPPGGHVFLDLGGEAPRIGAAPAGDPAGRARLLMRAAGDPSVGVVILDFVLGTHPDPVGSLAGAIVEAKAMATARGRHFEILGYVLGSDDASALSQQTAALVRTGATWASSSTNTGLLAREFVVKG